MSNNKDKTEGGSIAHRENELYTYYADQLLENAKASQDGGAKPVQEKTEQERKS